MLTLKTATFGRLMGWSTKRARRYLQKNGMCRKFGGRWIATIDFDELNDRAERGLSEDLYEARMANPAHVLNSGGDASGWLAERLEAVLAEVAADGPLMPPKPPLMAPGRVVHRLLVIREVEPDPHYGKRWLCECDCGREKVVLQANLRSRRTKSCGCRGKYRRKNGRNAQSRI